MVLVTPISSFGVQAPEGEVDRETYLVRVERMHTVNDWGKVLNPMALEGQVEGSNQMGVENARE